MIVSSLLVIRPVYFMHRELLAQPMRTFSTLLFKAWEVDPEGGVFVTVMEEETIDARADEIVIEDIILQKAK